MRGKIQVLVFAELNATRAKGTILLTFCVNKQGSAQLLNVFLFEADMFAVQDKSGNAFHFIPLTQGSKGEELSALSVRATSSVDKSFCFNCMLTKISASTRHKFAWRNTLLQ